MREIAEAKHAVGEAKRDDQAEKEEISFEEEGQAEAEMAQLRTQSFAQDITLRKYFAVGIPAGVVGWMIAVLIVLASVDLPNAVGVALASSTSVNVIGLLYVVVRYLFPVSQAPDEPKG